MPRPSLRHDRGTGHPRHRVPHPARTLDQAGESYTPDGTAACRRLLADFPTARLGRLSFHTQPNAWFHFMADHAVTFSVIPLSPPHPRPHHLARARRRRRGRRLRPRHADQGVEGHQRPGRGLRGPCPAGVSSPAYLPGPYSPTERQVEAFVTWYVTRLRGYLERQR
ncbi:SRPBCC family protein [Streptomyces sp. M19]